MIFTSVWDYLHQIYAKLFLKNNFYTVMCCLMMGICSKKWVLRQFYHCENTKLDILHIWDMWYYLLLLGYKPVQNVLNTIGNCNTLVSIYVSKHRRDVVKLWYKMVQNGISVYALIMNGVCRTTSCSGWVSEWVKWMRRLRTLLTLL